MNSVDKLKKELIQAENQQKQLEEELQQYKNNFEGRYFKIRFDCRKSRCAGAVFYTNFRIDRDELKYDKARCYVTLDPKYCNEIGVSNSISGETVSHSRIFGENHTQEITKEEFNCCIKTIKALQEKVYYDFSNDLPYKVDNHKPKAIVFDALHLLLSPQESSVFHDSVFLIENMYIITPNSVQAAISKIEADFEWLGRGSAYYEECDMRYVNSKTQLLIELREKFSKY